MNISGDTLVLFKFDRQIIVSAIVKKSEKFKIPEVRRGVNHNGALYLDISTRGNKIEIENLDIIIQLINKNIGLTL